MSPRIVAVILLSLSSAGCQEREISVPGEASAAQSITTALESPAAPGSGEPFLSTASDGSILMSWLEPSDGESHALRFARFRDEAWSAPVTIREGSDFFVNWADFPSVIETVPGKLLAHWLQKSGEGTYAYDVKIAWSADGGATWSEGTTLHDDGVVSEHGFVSLVPAGDGSGKVGAVWLDGRNMTGGGHGGHGEGAMTTRFATITSDGGIAGRRELDDRVCECCQTSMTWSDGGFVAVYRDRSADEVRDIAVVRQQADGWSEPSKIHDDGWQIAACPVNGPQIDALGPAVVVAWATGAGGEMDVNAVFSGDGGQQFGAPVRVDEGGALGRVDTIMIDDSSALIVWLAQDGEGTGQVLARIVRADGTRGEAHVVGTSASSRAAGFPRISRSGDRVYIAWTEPGDPSEIRIRSIKLEEIS